ncbi:MAG TPA: single-stranded DNA-binding protein [Rubrobacter sp.]|nr:single-stranded DNA-binding protein [Rubrobacter sp.]
MANGQLQQGTLAGNFTRDPELRFTQGGEPVCGFGLAVNDKRSKREDAVDFFDIAAWRELGETVANYKKKGDPILVEGNAEGGNNGSSGSSAGTSRSGGRAGQDADIKEEDWEDIPFAEGHNAKVRIARDIL